MVDRREVESKDEEHCRLKDLLVLRVVMADGDGKSCCFSQLSIAFVLCFQKLFPKPS